MLKKKKKVSSKMFSKPYVSVQGGVSLWNIDSGGLNKEAGVQNTGNDDGSSKCLVLTLELKLIKRRLA